MIIDGRAIAESLYSDLLVRRGEIERPIVLGVVIVGDDPVIEQFVRIKARAAARLGVDVRQYQLAGGVQTADVIRVVAELANESSGIIVQLPLPAHIDTTAVLSVVPKEKDVDALNPTVSDDEHPVFAPVALAVAEILKQVSFDPIGKRTVVVGAGKLVGLPSAAILKRLGALVSIVTDTHGSLDELKNADIVVLGAGNPGFIKPEHLKKGVVLIDAGTSESGGKVVGDADPACAEVASIFTPVPGGVGPISVAMIFKNLFDLVDKATK